MSEVIPKGTEVAGTFGIAYLGTKKSDAEGNEIHYQQKAPGTNGQIILEGSQTSIEGQIRLSASAIETIQKLYGTNAKVTSLGVWVIQSVIASSTGLSAATYSGTVFSAAVYLYINGADQPVGPIVF